MRHRRRSLSRGRTPAPARKAVPPPESLARVENSLYLSIQAIKKNHRLERLGISFYDSQTTLNWSYNADAYFHAASTIKLAVLVGVYGEVWRGKLTADAPLPPRKPLSSNLENPPLTPHPGNEPNQEGGDKLRQNLNGRRPPDHPVTNSRH